MYQNVVVPLDGSSIAEQVLPHVKDLISGRTTRVHLISIAPLSPVGTGAGAPLHLYPLVISPADLELHAQERDRIEEELRNYLRGIAIELTEGNVKTQVEVRFGEPAEEILAYAEDVKANLIAMCTHGRTGLARWAYGSIAEKVMRHADCPVLLIRAKAE